MVKKSIVFVVIAVFSLVGMFFWQWFVFSDGRLHVVFCNVGQGDAIYIRTPKGFDMLVDGGSSNAVLSCLSRHMPFWDRTIDIVLLTHPHADHMAGFPQVFKEYKVNHFVTENLENDTDIFKLVMDTVAQQKIPKRFVVAGNRIKMPDGVSFSIVGPSADFLEQTSPGGKIGESAEFASVETLVSYGNFKLLLTGDSQAGELEEGIESPVDVLQAPHHGSKTGLNDKIIEAARPGLVVISVGKNKYGHPSPQTIKILEDSKVKILRTDEKGDIEVVSDGERWFVRGID